VGSRRLRDESCQIHVASAAARVFLHPETQQAGTSELGEYFTVDAAGEGAEDVTRQFRYGLRLFRVGTLDRPRRCHRGNPNPRSPTMVRWISLVPA
jgi:hypothetical protein